MRVGLVLRELHASENELADELLRVAQRHTADQEIHHVGRDIAAWSQSHVREIARIARTFGEDLVTEPEGAHAGTATAPEEGGRLVGHTSSPGLLLVRDLRGLYLLASGVSADWEMLGQAAQGIRHAGLIAVTRRCRAETVRQVRSANGKLKEFSAQVLLS